MATLKAQVTIAIQHLLDHLNAAKFIYPGTDLRLTCTPGHFTAEVKFGPILVSQRIGVLFLLLSVVSGFWKMSYLVSQSLICMQSLINIIMQSYYAAKRNYEKYYY